MADKTHPLDSIGFPDYPMWLRFCSVKSRTTTAQPVSPADGDRYIIPADATGTDWAGKAAGTLTEWHRRNYIWGNPLYPNAIEPVASWYMFDPNDGFMTKVIDEGGVQYTYDLATTDWQLLSALFPGATPYHEAHLVTGTDVSNGYIDLTVSTYATGNNSLQVRSNGVWLSTEEGDYTETSTSRVSFTSGVLVAGGYIIFDWKK